MLSSKVSPTPVVRRTGLKMSHHRVPASDVAVCASRVGLVERRDLRVITVTGRDPVLASLARRRCERPLAVGGCVETAGCWWTRPAHDRLVIYCPSGSAERVERILRAETVHHPGLVADRRRDSYMLLGVVGHCAPQVLEALGVRLPDGGSFGGTGVTVLDGAAVTWLAESPESVIACVPANRGEDVAASIERAGSPYGMVRISEEAFAHWSVGDRQRRRLTR